MAIGVTGGGHGDWYDGDESAREAAEANEKIAQLESALEEERSLRLRWEDALVLINDIIFAAGAPLGSVDYFAIRDLTARAKRFKGRSERVKRLADFQGISIEEALQIVKDEEGF